MMKSSIDLWHEYLDDDDDEDVDNDDQSDAKKIAFFGTEGIFKKLQNSSFEGAAIYNNLDLTLRNYKKKSGEKLFFNKLDENILSYNLAIIFSGVRHPLHSTLKRKIKQLIQGGFFNFWINQYLNHPSILEQEIEEIRVVLTMDHLSVGFTIWLAMLLIAFIVFMVELAQFYLRIYLKSILIKIFLRSFYKFNH